MKFSKIVVGFMLSTVLIFTAAVLYAGFVDKTINDALIVSFFAFMGVEGGAMAWIKTTESKKEKENKND